MNLEEATNTLATLSGKPTRPFATQDFGREKNPAARSVVVPENKAPDLVTSMRQKIGQEPLVVFIGDSHDAGRGKAEVVLAPGKDQFDILRAAQTNGGNYGLTTERLIEDLQGYDAKYGINIIQAETDSIGFYFRTVPGDPVDLAQLCVDLTTFCPDIAEDPIAANITKSRKITLWWD